MPIPPSMGMHIHVAQWCKEKLLHLSKSRQLGDCSSKEFCFARKLYPVAQWWNLTKFFLTQNLNPKDQRENNNEYTSPKKMQSLGKSASPAINQTVCECTWVAVHQRSLRLFNRKSKWKSQTEGGLRPTHHSPEVREQKRLCTRLRQPPVRTRGLPLTWKWPPFPQSGKMRRNN